MVPYPYKLGAMPRQIRSDPRGLWGDMQDVFAGSFGAAI